MITTERTWRRKAQKKKKRRERKRCSFCGSDRVDCRLWDTKTSDDMPIKQEYPVPGKRCRDCGKMQVLSVDGRVLELADKYRR